MIASQHIVTSPEGVDILVTVWDDGSISAAPRIDNTRWGVPLRTRRAD